MSISSVSAFAGVVGSVGSSLSAGQNKPASPLEGDLAQIREKGLSAWAHDQQMEKLKAKLRDQALSDKKLSEADVAAMPADKQASVEDEIARMIAEKLQQTMQAKVRDAAEQGKTQAVLLDISV